MAAVSTVNGSKNTVNLSGITKYFFHNKVNFDKMEI